MDACLRLNFTIKQFADTRIVLPQFVGRASGLPIDFSGCIAVMNHGQYGQQPAVLTLGSLATANGAVLLNQPGLGYVTLHWTPTGAGVLAAIARSFTHFLKVVCSDGSDFPLVVGADAITPGW